MVSKDIQYETLKEIREQISGYLDRLAGTKALDFDSEDVRQHKEGTKKWLLRRIARQIRLSSHLKYIHQIVSHSAIQHMGLVAGACSSKVVEEALREAWETAQQAVVRGLNEMESVPEDEAGVAPPEFDALMTRVVHELSQSVAQVLVDLPTHYKNDANVDEHFTRSADLLEAVQKARGYESTIEKSETEATKLAAKLEEIKLVGRKPESPAKLFKGSKAKAEKQAKEKEEKRVKELEEELARHLKDIERNEKRLDKVREARRSPLSVSTACSPSHRSPPQKFKLGKEHRHLADLFADAEKGHTDAKKHRDEVNTAFDLAVESTDAAIAQATPHWEQLMGMWEKEVAGWVMPLRGSKVEVLSRAMEQARTHPTHTPHPTHPRASPLTRRPQPAARFLPAR